MKTLAVVPFRLALALLAFVLAPGPAHAGLVEATASFITLPVPPGTQILGGTATVSGSVEFTGSTGDGDWRLDLTATGFTLALDCGNVQGDDCDYPDGLRLSLTGLDFSPPAALVGLTELPVSPNNPLVVSGTPLVTASSVVIDFEAYEGSTGSDVTNFVTLFAAEFQVQPVAATPLPGALVLVAVGALGAAALAIRRARA